MNQHENEFEQKLKLHTENYVMYPSSKVWDGLQKQLHINNRSPYQKRYAVMALFVAGVLLSNFFIHNNSLKDTKQPIAKNEMEANTDNNINKIIENKIIEKVNVFVNNNKKAIENKPSINIELNTKPIYNSIKTLDAFENELNKTEVVSNNQALAIQEMVGEFEEAPNTFSKEATSKLDAVFVAPAVINTGKPFDFVNKDNKTKVLHNFEVKTTEVVKNEIDIAKAKDLQNVNAKLPIDKKIFTKKQNNGWHINAIMVPTMSNIRIKNFAAYGDLNNVKKFNNLKPKMGVELGVQMQYKKNKTSYIIGGQVNVYGNKFTGYDANGLELTLARSTLSLNTNTFDSSYSFLRTVGSKSNAKEYKNNFVSVSMPIGVNYNVASISKNVNFYIAGMAAPSLMLYANNYTMSANLKNYIKVPDELRKWNVSGILSTYVEFGGKNMSFQLGPQLSYQLFSIYKDNYHIKEASRDLGLRLGIVKKF
jgi:hypothetical protein